jgi:hypothetical protein
MLSMNYHNTIVSKFRNKFDTVGTPVKIGDFLANPEAEKIVKAIRNTTEKTDRDIIKGRNPAITVSSSCTRRAGAVFNTGLVMVDIDGHQNPGLRDMPGVVQFLKGVPFIWYCGLSASGRGCFCVIPVSTDAFRTHWYALESYFKNLNTTIDPEPKSPGSLRYQSWDDAGWFNHDCRVFEGVETREIKAGTARKVTPETLVRVRRCLDQITARRMDICSNGNRGLIIAAFANGFGKGGFEMAWEATRWHETATRENTWSRLNSFLAPGYEGNKVGLGTFFHICEGYGIK